METWDLGERLGGLTFHDVVGIHGCHSVVVGAKHCSENRT